MASIKRCIRSGCVQVVLCVQMAFPLHGRVAAAQEGEMVDRATREREVIYQELRQQRQMIDLLMQLIARQQLTPEERQKEASARDAAIEAAKRQIEVDNTDFGSAHAVELRKQLKGIVDTISTISITPTTEEETVDKFIDQLQEGKDLVEKARAEAINRFNEAAKQAKLDLLTRRFIGNDLKPLEDKILQDVLHKLDPSLAEELLKSLTKDDLIARIGDYSDNGNWSIELIAALGPHLKDLGMDVAAPVIEAAKDVADTYRAGAEFAAFAVPVMEAALSTGNPWIIAGAAVLLAIIALFKFVFGGGGGGDGDGAGKGKSGDNRNKNAPGPSPAGAPELNKNPNSDLPPSDVPLVDEDGELYRYISEGVLHVLERDTKKEVFSVPLADIQVFDKNETRPLGIEPQTIVDIQVTSTSEPFGFDIVSKESLHKVTQIGDKWLVLAGELVPPSPDGPPGDFRLTQSGKTVYVYRGGKLEFTFDSTDVFGVKDGKYVRARFEPSQIKQVISITVGPKDQRRIQLVYGDVGSVILTWDYEGTRWLVNRDFPALEGTP